MSDIAKIRSDWRYAAWAWNRDTGTDRKRTIELGEDLYFAGLAAVMALRDLPPTPEEQHSKKEGADA